MEKIFYSFKRRKRGFFSIPCIYIFLHVYTYIYIYIYIYKYIYIHIYTENGKNILLTREEKERIFLDSIQSYYFEGQNGLSDIQFDKLRSVRLYINLCIYMYVCIYIYLYVYIFRRKKWVI
jgi:hypothetical protein